MECKKCGGVLKESVNYKKGFLSSYYKIYTYFCVNCDFEKIKTIKIDKNDFFNSLEIRNIKAKNTKYESTDKKYDQIYKTDSSQ